jgi:LPXTG-motif cell wall-anchored protein
VVYDVICDQYGGGHLYRIYTGSYVYYRIEWVNQECVIDFQNEYPGYPPDTGVDIPMPLVLSGAVAVGAILLAAGLLLRRRSREATQ